MPGSPRQSWWTEQRDLYTLLLKFHESKASNPRDMIYALLSMATDVEAIGFPTINYNLSVQEILEQTVLFLFPCQWKQNIPNYQTFLDLIKDLMMLNNMAILEAAENGQDIVLHRLTTRAGVEPNFSDARGRTSLLCAIDQGHVGVVRHLLTLPSTNTNLLDEEKRTPLLRAIGKHRTEIANLLLNTPGVDVRCPDREGRTPLCLAVETKQHAIVEYLLDSGCPTTVDRERILPLAVQNDDAEIFLRLLKYGSFNSIIRERWESASTLCTWMFTTLTGDNGANINARDCEGKTLLSIAIEQRLLDLVQRLTKVDGLDVTFQDGKGETPMTNAVKTRDKELVEFLQHQLQKVDRVAVNMLNRSSENPLLIAVEMGDMDMVSTLLKADGIIFWATGTTSPLDAAKSRKDEEMVKFLIAHHVYAKGISIAQIVNL
jgi:ankyrin repeat protein